MSTVNGGVSLVKDGLILYGDVANPRSFVSGSTIWFDISRSTNSSNGTLINSPTYNSSNGGSIIFDGANNYVDFGNKTTYNLIDISISSWVYPTGANSFNPLITRYGQTLNYNGWSMSYSSTSSKFSFGGRETISSYINTDTINTFSQNKWYNVVGTKSANTWSIYVNGVFENLVTGGTGNISFSSNTMYVSADKGIAYNFYGSNKISEILIYNRTLSSSEILQNFDTIKSRFGL